MQVHHAWSWREGRVRELHAHVLGALGQADRCLACEGAPGVELFMRERKADLGPATMGLCWCVGRMAVQ